MDGWVNILSSILVSPVSSLGLKIDWNTLQTI